MRPDLNLWCFCPCCFSCVTCCFCFWCSHKKKYPNLKCIFVFGVGIAVLAQAFSAREGTFLQTCAVKTKDIQKCMLYSWGQSSGPKQRCAFCAPGTKSRVTCCHVGLSFPKFAPGTKKIIPSTNSGQGQACRKWVGKGKGSVERALIHYATTPDADLWKLMSQQVESYPDQGLDRKTKGGEGDSKKEKGTKRKSPPSGSGARDYQEHPRLCLACRKRHEPRCELTAEWRAEQKQKKKDARAKAKKGKGKGDSPKKG